MRLRRHIFGCGDLVCKVYIYKRYIRSLYMMEDLAYRAIMVVTFVVMVVGYRD